jgi:hypothetical protein
MPYGPCIHCGATNYNSSVGGPMICPSCDCGNPPHIGNPNLLGSTWPLPIGVYVLPPDDFDKVLHDLENPSPPTESIRRGAELLRKLYRRS